MIPPQEEITIAFALHAAGNLADLITSARYADTLYNFTFNAPKPTVSNVEVCYSDDAILSASGATKFNWYREPTGGIPLSSESDLLIPDLDRDTTLYVSNAEKSYESLRSAISVKVKPRPTIVASGPMEFCDENSVILTAREGGEYTWSTGAKTKEIEITVSGSYTVAVNEGSIECTSLPAEIIVHESPTTEFIVSSEDKGEGYLASFSNESTGASAWRWDFGDGHSSDEENPSHVYDVKDEYTITLTSISAYGCENSISKPLNPVTGSEVSLERVVTLYPNPVVDDQLVISHSGIAESLKIEVFNSQGRLINHSTLDQNISEVVLNLSGLAGGVYLVRIVTPEETVVKKIVVNR